VSGFEGVVHTFVAEALGKLGLEPVAMSTAEDEGSTVVICENGDVYRVRVTVRADEIS
jgi:hypothetical protein